MERIRLSIVKDDNYDDWFSFYRYKNGKEDFAWDNSCFEDLCLDSFIDDYNFGRRMKKHSVSSANEKICCVLKSIDSIIIDI